MEGSVEFVLNFRGVDVVGEVLVALFGDAETDVLHSLRQSVEDGESEEDIVVVVMVAVVVVSQVVEKLPRVGIDDWRKSLRGVHPLLYDRRAFLRLAARGEQQEKERQNQD